IRSVAVYEHPKLREGLELLPEINRNVKDLTDKLIGKETGSAPIIKHSPTGLIPLESSPESENSDSYDIVTQYFNRTPCCESTWITMCEDYNNEMNESLECR
ncbi:MAG: hypothetical protein KGD67_11750, partial [Candidatus Lokiarchaeota archaeon]|nr:hypothetical protein [Candidatus Lokiarchaeota archaeon]